MRVKDHNVTGEDSVVRGCRRDRKLSKDSDFRK